MILLLLFSSANAFRLVSTRLLSVAASGLRESTVKNVSRGLQAGFEPQFWGLPGDSGRMAFSVAKCCSHRVRGQSRLPNDVHELSSYNRGSQTAAVISDATSPTFVMTTEFSSAAARIFRFASIGVAALDFDHSVGCAATVTLKGCGFDGHRPFVHTVKRH